MRLSLRNLALLSLALLLSACGGGGDFFEPDTPSAAVLSEALYVSAAGTYEYRTDYDVVGIPPEADMTRISVAGGIWARLFALEHGGGAVYMFEARQNGVFSPAHEFRIPIIDVPRGTSLQQIATVDVNGKLRLYLQNTRRRNVFYQFAYVRTATGPAFQFAADGVRSSLAVTGMPADADYSRFSFHHAGSTYRFMCHRKGSETVMYQAGWRNATKRYEYGYSSRDAVAISMPDGVSANSKVLHDGSNYRAFRLRHR